MKNLVLLLFFLLPATTVAQYKRGMIKDNGAWKNPTPETALRALMEGDVSERAYGSYAALAVLRQRFDTRPAAELDAFADELARSVIEGTNEQSYSARGVLTLASMDFGDGTPYAGAVDVLIRVYELLQGRDHRKVKSALFDVFDAGGVDFVKNVFGSSDPPKEACKPCGGTTMVDCKDVANQCPYESAWCDAGKLLAMNTDEGPAPEDVLPVCFGSIEEDGVWLHVVY